MIKTIKINEMKIIQQVAIDKGIGAAAITLKTTQAHVSRTLISVEKRCGLKVFDRTTHSIKLSEFGKALLPKINDLIDLHDDTISFIDSYKDKDSGQVLIVAPTGIVNFLAKNLIPSFSQNHPNILISLSILQSERILPVDLKFDILFSPYIPDDEHLTTRKIVSLRMGFFATKEYIENNHINTPEDIMKNKCIVVKLTDEWQYFELVTGEVITMNVKGDFLCTDHYSGIELAKSGLGVVYSPWYMVADYLEDGSLIPCIPKTQNVEVYGYIIYKTSNYQPYRVKTIIDAIIDYMKNSAPLFK